MNKPELKRAIKLQIENKREKLQKQTIKNNYVAAAADKIMREHYSNNAATAMEHAANLVQKAWNLHMTENFGNMSYKLTNLGTHINGIRTVENEIRVKVVRILNYATSADTLPHISYEMFGDGKVANAISKVVQELKTHFIDGLDNLNTLEREMLAIVSAAKNADEALETLKNLGIDTDGLKSKYTPEEMRLSVTVLSVDPAVFNS